MTLECTLVTMPEGLVTVPEELCRADNAVLTTLWHDPGKGVASNSHARASIHS
jgi:hypothetical protein